MHAQSKWKNKTRVLVFSSRGVSFIQKRLMSDIRTLMPHSKPGIIILMKLVLKRINYLYSQLNDISI